MDELFYLVSITSRNVIGKQVSRYYVGFGKWSGDIANAFKFADPASAGEIAEFYKADVLGTRGDKVWKLQGVR